MKEHQKRAIEALGKGNLEVSFPEGLGKWGSSFAGISSAELRLNLATTESQKPNSLRAICIKRDTVRDITNELIRRGSY